MIPPSKVALRIERVNMFKVLRTVIGTWQVLKITLTTLALDIVFQFSRAVVTQYCKLSSLK
jgi:hypothetical protein